MCVCLCVFVCDGCSFPLFCLVGVKLAINIGDEVRHQNSMLDGMGGTFEDAGGALGRTIGEVKRLASSGSGGHMCVLFLFAFVFFLLVYLLLR